jgi:hypothetical protein
MPGIRHPSLGPVCRSNKSQPSVMIQWPPGFCTWTKPRHVNPSAHNSLVGSFSLSLTHSLSSTPQRASKGTELRWAGEEDSSATASPLASVRAHRWVDALPSRGLTMVSITHIHVMASSGVWACINSDALLHDSDVSQSVVVARPRRSSPRVAFYPCGAWI